MICIIKNNCFKAQYLKSLKLIIGLVSESSPVDSITVDDPQSFESNIFKQLDQEDQKILRRSFDGDIISSKTKVIEKIVIDENGELEDSAKIFSPQEAITYLKESLSILVENGFHDGTFIKQIITFFGKDRHRIALDKCKFEFDNSGGCQNVTNTINGKLLSFKNKSKFLRFFVLWDSDRNYPNEPVKKYKKEEAFLQKLNIKYHILEKRAMENYLPIDAYQALSFPRQKKWFESYKNLSDTQKDYYNIADGFKYAGKVYSFSQKKDISITTNGLFNNLPESVWNWLSNGLNISHFKEAIPKKFEDYSICNYKSLNERIVNQLDPNEFKNIIGKLDLTL